MSRKGSERAVRRQHLQQPPKDLGGDPGLRRQQLEAQPRVVQKVLKVNVKR